ncbi:hypothetical protein ABK905_26120 [Acerihabitans sp. KWT182]|uniref:Uncharacterized protein n=1 Tax=Acerihabitans sp. KWT182 TaxID=3157919 RepID=A0AAU7QAM1_9GAMM
MPAFWVYMIPCTRDSILLSVNGDDNSQQFTNLKKVSNSPNEYHENTYVKDIGVSSFASFSSAPVMASKLPPRGFKHIFIDFCLNEFFSQSKDGSEKTFIRYSESTDFWIQYTIQLYACSHYIVSHYINVCAMQQQASAKSFKKHMRALRRLIVSNSFDQTSKFLYTLDRNGYHYSSLKKLLDKIDKAIIDVFDHKNGPSDKLINMLLSNHSVVAVKNQSERIVINHSYDVAIKKCKKRKH